MTVPSVLAALILVGLLAGCFGPGASPVRVVPYLPLVDAEPGRATEFAFFLESTSAFKQVLPVTAADLPAGWDFTPETADATLAGGKGASLIVRVTPDANATYGPHALGVKVGNTRSDVIVNVRDLGDEPLRAGVGTRLHYVLWLDNGTLFATNEHGAADQVGIPKQVQNETPDYSPLKVYVGGRRGEAPPEPYNSTGCEGSEQPPCYHPVISGFDERLQDAGDGRGMVAGETLAIRIPKDQAYTLPGNEQHALYGESLNFLIHIVSVDVLPVRACDLPVCPPRSLAGP